MDEKDVTPTQGVCQRVTSPRRPAAKTLFDSRRNISDNLANLLHVNRRGARVQLNNGLVVKAFEFSTVTEALRCQAHVHNPKFQL